MMISSKLNILKSYLVSNMFNTARNLTIIYIIYLVLSPLPMVIEASVDVSGSVPEIELRADEKTRKDKPSKVVAKIETVEGRCPLVENLLSKIGGNDKEIKILSRIAYEESKCDVKAVNSTNGVTGIFQYTWGTFYDHGCDRWGRRADWRAQTRCALQDYRRGLLNQWQVTWYW